VVHQRLLEIAIAEFAAKGLEGASTRGIAAAAGTAMSSITYHFGGKEGLYLAAADYIASQIGGHLAPAIQHDGIPPGTTPDTARALIHEMLSHWLEMMAGAKNPAFSLFIMREQMEPTEAFERIYGGLMGRMLGLMVDLVCIATGSRDTDASRVVVVTLMGQVIVLRASRATVLKLLQRDDIDPATTATLTARIVANTNAILDQMIAEQRELP
jgi:AcrR family transcriptional regulator